MGGCSCRDISVLKEPGKACEPVGHTLPPPPAAPALLQMMLFAEESPRIEQPPWTRGWRPLAILPSDLSPTQLQLECILSGQAKWVLAWANLY